MAVGANGFVAVGVGSPMGQAGPVVALVPVPIGLVPLPPVVPAAVSVAVVVAVPFVVTVSIAVSISFPVPFGVPGAVSVFPPVFVVIVAAADSPVLTVAVVAPSAVKVPG